MRPYGLSESKSWGDGGKVLLGWHARRSRASATIKRGRRAMKRRARRAQMKELHAS